MKAIAARVILGAWMAFLAGAMWLAIRLDVGADFGVVTSTMRLIVVAFGAWLLGDTVIEVVRARRQRVRGTTWLARLVLAASIATPSAGWAAGDDVVMTRIPTTTTTEQPVAAPTPPPSDTYTVVSGDSLWRIARQVLTDSWQRRPTASEMTPYWLDVVDAARPSLRDPTNPSLIYPGQELPLPPLPPAP